MVLKDCIRVFLFIINSVTVIVGFAITAVGVYCVSKSKSDPFTDIETGNLVGFIVCTLLIGLFVLLLGLLGCFGSLTQSPRMMNVYMGLIMLVLVMEVGVLVGSLVAKGSIVRTAEEGFQKYVDEYHSNETDGDVKRAVDAIQFNLECCGVDGPSDYLLTNESVVPASCCGEEETEWEECGEEDKFQDGCKDKLHSFIGDVISLFGVVIGFAVLLDVISLFGALYVKKNSPKYDHLA